MSLRFFFLQFRQINPLTHHFCIVLFPEIRSYMLANNSRKSKRKIILPSIDPFQLFYYVPCWHRTRNLQKFRKGFIHFILQIFAISSRRSPPKNFRFVLVLNRVNLFILTKFFIKTSYIVLNFKIFKVLSITQVFDFSERIIEKVYTFFQKIFKFFNFKVYRGGYW